MSGRGDAGTSGAGADLTGATDGERAGHPGDGEVPEHIARRARRTAVGAGALLALAGLSGALRASASAPVLAPVAYALGAAVCALAALLGSRGHTRRALWLLVAGVMAMALGDQVD